MKEKKGIRSRKALTGLLILGISLGWLLSMTLLTVVLAQEIYEKLYEESYSFSTELSDGFNQFYDKNSSRYGYQNEHPDYFDYCVLGNLSVHTQAGVSSWRQYSDLTDRGKLIRKVTYPMETAVLFYDGEGKLLHTSNEEALFFDYFTQEEWEAGANVPYATHCAWIDISEGKNAEDEQEDPYQLFRVEFQGMHWLYEFKALRITGSFEGTQFLPVSLYYVTATQLYEVFRQAEAGASLISLADRGGWLDWQCLFDKSAEHPGKGLVTIYAESPRMWDYPRTAFSYNGTEYESLAALTKTLNFPAWAKVYQQSASFREMGKFSLGELLVFDGRRFADYEGFDYFSGGEPETEYYMITAVRSRPLYCAMSALRNIYILSGLLALLLFFLIRNCLKKRLTDPLEQLSAAVSGDSRAYLPENDLRPWREAEQLTDFYISAKNAQHKSEYEITRLKTALAYAEDAEKSRRAMISALAHELKTPLAVIHSYAEGLKSQIAEEKREKYLDTILTEAERTDSLVLEMLDLSRLEAGKVRLASDEFSLKDLTRSVFVRLEPLVQAKKLEVSFDFPEDAAVTADESRIAQVIENFATNAIKYTPEGGRISVTVRTDRLKTSFRMENDSAPLSAETLSKLWEPFYRADEARSGEGSGLGLAIARNIVQLHGGKCSAQNTDGGVAFSFTLPKR
ncbi:MAG: hypothetical protein J5496_04015 [Lachnospiraceae bacterium]|nr:hypothetical protein [Lachnospiraceae bacterium]